MEQFTSHPPVSSGPAASASAPRLRLLREPRKEPARWRQALMIWLTTYPTVVLHLWLLRPLLDRVPMWLGALIVTVPVAVIVVYLVTPLAMRAMYGWLMTTSLARDFEALDRARSLPVRSGLLQRFQDTVNAGDSQGWLALFTEDAQVTDWGRRFRGRMAIQRWNAAELIGARGTLKLSGEEPLGERVRVLGDWASDRFSGPATFTFTLRAGRIASVEIDPL